MQFLALIACRHWAHGTWIYYSITVAGWIEQVTYNDFVGWLFEDLFLCAANTQSLHPLLWNEANDKCYVQQCLYKKHRILIFQVLLHVTMINKYCRLTWFIMLTGTRHVSQVATINDLNLKPELLKYHKCSVITADWQIPLQSILSSYGIQNASVSAENNWT